MKLPSQYSSTPVMPLSALMRRASETMCSSCSSSRFQDAALT